VIQHQPHRAGTDLRRELVACLLAHGSTFSRVGASGKPGAVQLWPCIPLIQSTFISKKDESVRAKQDSAVGPASAVEVHHSEPIDVM
jgi:hypothetical protein